VLSPNVGGHSVAPLLAEQVVSGQYAGAFSMVSRHGFESTTHEANTSGCPAKLLFTLGIRARQRTSRVVIGSLASRGIIQSKGTATMTPFRNPSILSRALLAGLLVTTIFSAPLQARENHAGDRHIEQSVGASILRIEGARPIAAPAHNAFAPVPLEQTEGVCDHGDNPMVC